MKGEGSIYFKAPDHQNLLVWLHQKLDVSESSKVFHYLQQNKLHKGNVM